MDYVSFQIVDIISDDIPDDQNNKSFLVTIYGIDENNNRIVCHVKKYCPYFYIKIPTNWDENEVRPLLKEICGLQIADNPNHNQIYPFIKSIERCFHKEFYGLKMKDDSINVFNFLKISLKTHDAMKKLIRAIKKHYNLNEKDTSKLSSSAQERLSQWRKTEVSVNCDCTLYESSIHPVIRFIHDTKIEPTGWIKIKILEGQTNLFPSCKLEYFTSFNDIEPLKKNDLSSYRIASFDIECDSSHGDFPQATKDFKKLSTDTFDSYQSILKNIPETRRDNFNEKMYDNIKRLLQSGFTGEFFKSTSIWSNASMNQIHIVDKQEPSEEVYNDIINLIKETNISEYITDLDIKGKDRDSQINQLQDIINNECEKILLKVEGDPIIQIGTVFYDYGTGKTFRHILVLGNQDNLHDKEICDDIENIKVERCKTEKELLLGWKNIIKDQDPDFITGYNIFGFDFKYIYDRAEVLFPCLDKCNVPWWHAKACPMKEFLNFGKMNSDEFRAKDHKCKKCEIKTQQLSSAAFGDNTLNYITMDGRILFDIQKEVQKGHNLESYKLDNVAAHFMRGKIKDINDHDIVVSDTGNLKEHDFISFRTHSNIGEELFNEGKKYEISKIDKKTITLTEQLEIDLPNYHKVEWCLNKDDISPQQIFDKHKYEGSKGRAEVAKYCVQDCELCIHLLLLLDIVPNNLGMANVSYVPASFIFLRGQGVKVTSVVARKCDERNTRIPDLKKIPQLKDYIKMYKNGKTKQEIFEQIKEDADWRKPEPYELEDWYNRSVIAAEKGIDGFEGAIVLDPKPGIYLDDPVAVLDYASLYPSSIIEKNISHETHIEDHSLLPLIGQDNYHEVEYQNWIYINTGKGDTIEKKLGDGTTKCYFLKPEYMKEKGMVSDEEPLGIIPSVLNHLLTARSATKKLMKEEKNEFKKKVLDGLQLAYKVTANSVYGQLGARTSTIFKMNLAACTTSVGRSRIDDASNGVAEWALKKGYPSPDVIYGDTDSVFVKFSRIKDGKTLVGKEALKHCIQCGQEAGEYITKNILCHPQDLEYEKTFWPFILISKKRYTGDKYEFDTEDCKRTSMGIVLKRRDNAQIVKHVFGNVIEKIMIDKDFKLTLDWLKETLQMIRNGEFSMRYFVITKALRGYYKNPKGIAHKVLADRMAERDPGNKPKANDRIPYAYIDTGSTKQIIGYKKIKERIPNGFFKNGKPKFKTIMIDDLEQPKYKKINILQGDRIEHVDYIKEKKLDLDYEFYITNQIMNPVKQVLDLEMDSKETEELFSK